MSHAKKKYKFVKFCTATMVIFFDQNITEFIKLPFLYVQVLSFSMFLLERKFCHGGILAFLLFFSLEKFK